MPCALYVSADRPGFLYANGQPYSALSDKPKPLSLQGEAFLQFYPLGMEAGVSTVRFLLSGDTPCVDGGVLRLWPNDLLELRFEAKPSAGRPKPTPPEPMEVLQAKDFLTRLRDGQLQTAALGMSKAFASVVDMNLLRSYVGPFQGFEAPRFMPEGAPEHDAAVAAYLTHGSLRTMRIYLFGFLRQQGDLLIDDIRTY